MTQRASYGTLVQIRGHECRLFCDVSSESGEYVHRIVVQDVDFIQGTGRTSEEARVNTERQLWVHDKMQDELKDVRDGDTPAEGLPDAATFAFQLSQHLMDNLPQNEDVVAGYVTEVIQELKQMHPGTEGA